MRAACYVARRFAGFAALFSVLLVALGLSLWPSGRALESSYSPWVLAAPVLALAAAAARARSERLGEEVALAAGGASPFRRAIMVLAVGAVVQLLFCLPTGAVHMRPPRPAMAQASVAGDLLLRQKDGRVLFTADRRLVRLPGADGWPRGFVPRARHASGLRRRMFLASSPRAPSGHPLDPQGLRLLWCAMAVLLPALWIGVRRPSWLALLLPAPFLGILVLL